jgi:hypothetical protein
VLFYAWNNDPSLSSRKFDMTAIQNVLLPVTDGEFVVWFGAQNGNFNITIYASNAVKTIMGMVSVAAMAAFALF